MPSEWLWGLAGGLLIGLAASFYLIVNGRVMGASGILGGLADRTARGGDATERLAFIAGLVIVPAALHALTGRGDTHLTAGLPLLVLAGLLVGLGTRLARGCTSGHGVCGLSRLSPRGIVATALYLGAGVSAMFVFRHILGVI